MQKILLTWVLAICTYTTWATDKDKGKDPAGEKPPIANSPTAHKQLSYDMELALNKSLAKLERQLAKAENVQAIDKMLDVKEVVSVAAKNDRSKAQQLFSYLDANQDHVSPISNFSLDQTKSLPIGAYTGNGNNKIMLGILEAKFYPGYVEALAFVRIQFNMNGKVRDLFFGVNGLRFNNNGLLAEGSFKFMLLGDFIIPGEKWSLVFKGGTGVGDRNYSNANTYVEFECSDFKEASLAAEVVFPTNVLLPYNIMTGNAIKDGSRVSLRLLQAKFTKNESGANWLAGIDIAASSSKYFCIPGMEKFGFEMEDVWYDNSSIDNPVNWVPPTGYIGDTGSTWTGIYIKKFNVILPKSFKGDTQTDQAFGAQNVLIDRTGFTGRVLYEQLTYGNQKKFEAEKWKFNLSLLELDFLQNNFNAGRIAGNLSIPTTDEGDEGTNGNGRVRFIGQIINQDEYQIRAEVLNDVTIPMRALRSKAQLYTGSWVKLEYDGIQDKFFPSCNLSGQLEFVGKFDGGTKNAGEEGVSLPENTANSSPPLTPEAEATSTFKGIKFQNFWFRTKNDSGNPSASFGIEDFAYENNTNSKVGNFPVAITKLAKFKGSFNGKSPNANDLWIDFGFSLDLAKNINGNSNILVKSRYDTEKGKLRYSGLSLRSIEVDGQTSAFRLYGLVDIYDCADAKGFKGKLDLELKKPTIKFCASANFGYDKTGNFRYGYVDGFLAGGSGQGVPIGLGDIMVNGGGAGLYFNMKPRFTSASNTTSCSTSMGCDPSSMFEYTPDYVVPLGIKVMVSLTNPGGSFNAVGSLDFALNRNTGIDHIAITGVGTFGEAKLSADEMKTKLKDEANQAVKGDIASLTNTIDPSKNNTTDLLAKAKEKNVQRPANNKVKDQGTVAFDFGMMLDFPSKTLHAELAVWLNKGNLKGIGPDGQVGRAVLHADPSTFYLHVGKATPFNQRIGLRYGNNIALSAYLMVGAGVPSFPPPPARVMQYLNLKKENFGTSAADAEAIRTGSGIAFGAALAMTYDNNITRKLRVAGAVDAGFDIMLRNNSNCNMGGFFFNGQIYGYGDFDIYWKSKKKADVNVGVYLYGNGATKLGGQGIVKFRPPFIGFLTGTVEANIKVGDICRML